MQGKIIKEPTSGIGDLKMVEIGKVINPSIPSIRHKTTSEVRCVRIQTVTSEFFDINSSS